MKRTSPTWGTPQKISGFVAILLAITLLGSCSLFFGKTKVGIVISRMDSGFMASLVRGYQEANAKSGANSFEIITMDSKSDQENQLRLIDSLVQREVKVLVVNLVTREGAAACISKAKKAQLPIIFFNLEPTTVDMTSYEQAYYVGSLPEMSGGMQGEIAADFWKNNQSMDKNKDGVLQYVTLMGPASHPDTSPRTFAFKSILKTEGIPTEEIASDYANWSRPIAKKLTSQWLLAHPDKIEAIFANNDEMAMGAIDALRELGVTGPDKSIPVLGIDGSSSGLGAIEAGMMLGTVYNDVVNQGQAMVELTDALIRGVTINKTSVAPLSREDGSVSVDGRYVLVPYAKITPANYREFMKE